MALYNKSNKSIANRGKQSFLGCSLSLSALLCFCCVFVFSANPVFASEVQAHLAQEIEAFNMIKPSAAKGNSSAQRLLASMYEHGEGVDKDIQQAIYWYKKAAIQGDDIAQFYLGYMYYQAIGFEQDYPQAFSWFKKAAKQGNPDFEYNLGNLYRYGEGVAQNLDKTISWYAKAAEHGQIQAQTELSTMYWLGAEVKKDLVKAYFWRSIALDSQDPDEELVKMRNEMSPAQWADVQEQLNTWQENNG